MDDLSLSAELTEIQKEIKYRHKHQFMSCSRLCSGHKKDPGNLKSTREKSCWYEVEGVSCFISHQMLFYVSRFPHFPVFLYNTQTKLSKK